MSDQPYHFSEEEKKIFQLSPMPLIVCQLVNGQYRVLLASDSYCNMIHSDRNSVLEYLNQSSFSRVHPADVDKLAAFSVEAFSHKESHLFYRLSISGEYHTLLASAQIMLAKDHETKLGIVTYTDLGYYRVEDLSYSFDLPHTDQISGLPNSDYFDKFGEDYLVNLFAKKGSAAVAYFDIASLRSYNDHYGFLQGNKLIRTCAQTISKYYPDCLVIRYLDDSFLAIIPTENLAGKLTAISKEVASLAADKVTSLRAGVYRLNAKDTLSHAVDRAYLALRYLGDNRQSPYEVYNKTIQRYFENRDYLLGHFEEALTKGWLTVSYQPIYNIFSNKICSFEAVSRWESPGKPVKKARSFVPILENSGLIYHLDLHVLRQVCQLLKTRRANNLTNVPIAINLSQTDFRIPSFIDHILKITQEFQIPHYLLKFDLLALPDDSDQELLQKGTSTLQKHGFEIYLDRYGGENSDLSTEALINYNFSSLKIDLRNLQISSDKSKIVLTSIINMCHSLKISPIVKGIENQDMFAFVKPLGVMEVQGHYLSPELPQAELVRSPADKMETPEEQELYARIKKVHAFNNNLLTSGSLAYSPNSIFIWDNKKLTLVYSNQAFAAWVQHLGFSDLDSFVHACNVTYTSNYNHLWNAVINCNQEDNISQFDWITDAEEFKVRLQLVAKTDNMAAFLSDGYKVRDRPKPIDYQAISGIKEDLIKKALIETTNVGLFWKNHDLNFLGANQRFLDYFGLTLNELEQKKSLFLAADPRFKQILDQEEQILKDGVTIDNYLETTVKGRKRTFRYFLSPIYDESQISGLIGIVVDATAKMAELTSLRQEATRDPLTTLKNRRSFDRDFAYLTQRELMVMMIDVDHFKEFNDQFGHRYGDEVLKKVATCLLKTYGIGNCYRYGGDEFIVIWDFHTSKIVLEKDRQLRQLLSQIPILDLKFDIKISAGYVYGQASDEKAIYDMINQADSCLYHSKEQGRNQITGKEFHPVAKPKID
ncbi:diguanylate cyclase [Lactobacillus equicursoris]|uniref:Diguanylate cyclase n=1 Tax=Lactobacillus equicursoris TaxID=420645 RepID=A0A844FN45_9LACO|nr:EAL domain-containing protein [Lactobacillus equicursoris]MST80034.1 diguanylate cyclase [Lactobacillus equicursoris]